MWIDPRDKILIDILVELTYYYCYWKICRISDEEFKILKKMGKETYLFLHAAQTLKCFIIMAMQCIGFLGLYALNYMIIRGYMS